MACILGIDLGTSSVKSMLLEEEEGPVHTAACAYAVNIPQPGYAQQSPIVWWDAVKHTIQELKAKCPSMFQNIRAVGFSGQMHGLVLTGKDGEVLRPAIIWLDQRSDLMAKQMHEDLGMGQMGEIFHNRAFSGFAFPSLLWVKEREPEVFAKINSILMPKDYIRFRMTGELGADASDASSSCILDTGKREWAYDIIERYGIPKGIFPPVHEAEETAGYITRRCAKETGLPEGIPVVYGSGDQPAQSIGNGAVKEGLIISNIGTGGQISAYSATDIYDPKLRIHTFCHALNRAYTIFGATLCSGMSMNWLKDKILEAKSYQELSDAAAETEPGAGGLLYLPYLTGERTPHMDAGASGMFFGMRLIHDRRHFVRSVMEGVVYSLKDSLQIFEQMGLRADRIIASGGGAASPIWLQIQADILEKEICVSAVKEQACLGACILAGAGTGMLESTEEGVKRYVSFRGDTYEPRERLKDMYREQHRKYQQLYQAAKGLMR